MASEKAIEAKFSKLLAVAEEEHAKLGELLTEMRALLGGEAGVGDKLKAIEKAFGDAWAARYSRGNEKYLWRYAADRPHIKRMLKAGLDVDELARRIVRYLHDQDPYLRQARHPFGLFVTRVNQYAKAADFPETAFELDAGGVPDCKHQPPCKTDQEHTKKRSAEMRA